MAQLRHLQSRFPQDLLLIGVHSGKFPAEAETAHIRQAVLRHGIRHPVVNDPGFRIWDEYAVRAWPTVVLIDSRGKVVAQQAGEIDVDGTAQVIRQLLLDPRQERHRQPPAQAIPPEHTAAGPLRFPTRLLAPGDGRLFVADTGHHRVLEIYLDPHRHGGEVVRQWGNGTPGLQDGVLTTARFRAPHGLALQGQTLYVADTENHLIRSIDLAADQVSTVAGTGEMGRSLDPPATDVPRRVPLRSPWALWAEDQMLFIAMAGSHQIWLLIQENRLGIFAGTGAEALVDGDRAGAGFNQPSDLVLAQGRLFVADPEAGAVRAVDLEREGRVTTLVGQGLFEFGDRDGAAPEVRLQHPAGLAYGDGLLYLADSYNHKVKVMDPVSGRVQTLLGSGTGGYRDGPFGTAELYEPQGLALHGPYLYVADTNNHRIRVADLTQGTMDSLQLRGRPPSGGTPGEG